MSEAIQVQRTSRPFSVTARNAGLSTIVGTLACALPIDDARAALPDIDAVLGWPDAARTAILGGFSLAMILVVALQLYGRRRRQSAGSQTSALSHAQTGLPNRRAMMEFLQGAQRSSRGYGGEIALIVVAASAKQKAGAGPERSLATLARDVRQAIGDSAFLSVFGDNRLAVVMPYEHYEEVTAVAERITAQRSSGQPPLRCTIYPDCVDRVEEVVWQADHAEERAARDRRRRPRGGGGGAAIEARRKLETQLPKAIERRELKAYFQPIVDLDFGEVCGFEILVRWPNLTPEPPAPGQIIIAAAASHSTEALTELLLDEARTLSDKLPEHLFFAFNLSPGQLLDRQFGASFLELLAARDLPPSRFELEITDGTVGDIATARHISLALRDAGARLTFDRFGRGDSSLRDLRALPFDGLKIDRAVVSRLGADGTLQGLESTFDLAEKRSLETTAVGIESQRAAKMLQAAGCHRGQGHFYAHPMPAEKVEAYLAKVGHATSSKGEPDVAHVHRRIASYMAAATRADRRSALEEEEEKAEPRPKRRAAS